MQNSCQHCARRASTSTSPDRRASTPAREAPLLPGPGSCGQPRASTPTGTARAGARGCAGRPALRAGQPQTRQRERENRDNHPHPGPSRRVRQSAARRRVLGKATGQGDNGTLPRSRAATPARDNRGSVARGRTRPARCPSRGSGPGETWAGNSAGSGLRPRRDNRPLACSGLWLLSRIWPAGGVTLGKFTGPARGHDTPGQRP